MGDGCQIQRAEIENSVIGLRSQVSNDVRIKNTVVLGADYYDTAQSPISDVPLGIGPGCEIEGAIIDKNVRVGEKVTIKPFPEDQKLDKNNYVVRDGVVIIPKKTVLHPGTYIGPE
jgi:glucose-1-phosphate adenylyltransferase